MALRSTVEGSILNIGLNLVMIPTFGMMGAITATGIVMIYVVVRQLKVITSEMEITPLFPFIGKCLLYCLAASIPPSILSELNIGNLILNLFLYIITLVGLLICIKPFNDKQKQLLINVYPKFGDWFKWFFRFSKI